jgi:hypothetical protein
MESVSSDEDDENVKNAVSFNLCTFIYFFV